MWKSVFEIRLIRFEGITDFTKCEVVHNNFETEIIYPSTSGKYFRVSSDGKYQIIVKSDQSQYSVSFTRGLFNDEGMIWVPMFFNDDQFIETLPEEVEEPRVLLLVQKKQLEEVCSSIFTEESNPEPEFITENKENDTVIINDDKEISFCNENGIYESSLTYEITDTTRQEQYRDNKTIELQDLINHYNKNSVKDTENYSNIDKAIEYQQNLISHKILIDTNLNLISQKDEKILQAFKETLYLKNKIREYQVENCYLNSLNKDPIDQNLRKLNAELNSYKNKLAELEKTAKTKLFSKKILENGEKLEKAIKNECEKLNIPYLLKDAEEVYLHNGKKLNLLLKNGKLLCRQGNTYKEFSKYIDELNSCSYPNIRSMPSKTFYRKVSHDLVSPKKSSLN